MSNLPNPAMNFEPFSDLPDSDMDNLAENIDSLSAGTGINPGVLTGMKFALNSVSPAKMASTRYQVLASVTLGSPADTIDTGTFTAKNSLLILAFCKSTGGTINGTFRFNNDSANNYTYRNSDNNGTDGTNTSFSGVPLDPGTDNANFFAMCTVEGLATSEKLVVGFAVGAEATGAGSAPRRTSRAGKWRNSSDAITRVQVVNNVGTGDFNTGSILLVLGSN